MPPLSLVILSVACGVLTMLVFRAVSNPAAIRRVGRQVQAQLLALRLFGDEPALMWRALGRLLAANLRYIGAMGAPVALAAIPIVLAFPHLETLYGKAPLPIGGETILTLRFRKPFPDPLPRARLEMPGGLRAETPGVRVPEAGEISWRLRATGPVSQPVRVLVGDISVDKFVQVGTGRGYLAQATIDAPGIDSIQVAYRVERSWEGWFFAISMAAALLAKSRLGVVF